MIYVANVLKKDTMKKSKIKTLNKYNSKILDKYLTKFYIHATGTNDYGCHDCLKSREDLLLLLEYNYEQGIKDGRKEGLTWKSIIKSNKNKRFTFVYIKIIWAIEDFLSKLFYKLKGMFNARPKK
jgi:hypothetical protein